METPVDHVVRPLGKLGRLREFWKSHDPLMRFSLCRYGGEVPLMRPCTRLLFKHRRYRTVPYLNAELVKGTHPQPSLGRPMSGHFTAIAYVRLHTWTENQFTCLHPRAVH